MKKKVDLHIHSVYSDSDLTPKEIFLCAKKMNLSAIAITDHDTIESFPQAYQLSKEFDIEFIPGIEISCEYKGEEIHILGYFIDGNNKILQNALKDVKELRKDRLIKMAKRANQIGLRVDIDKLLEKVKNKIATRLHLALYLLETNQVNSLQEAFRRFLSPKSPLYIAGFKFSVKEAITLIKEAEGVASLAHPHFLSSPEELIKKFCDWGLDALEVVYPRFTPSMVEYFIQLATKYRLLVTGGSDSHGSFKEFTHIGALEVPYLWVENLKNARERHTIYKKNI